MNWLNRAEAKYGHLAIHGLIRYVVAFNAIVFFLALLNPHYIDFLTLNTERIMHGEVWRLVSYIFIPPFSQGSTSILFAAMYALFLLMVGNGLEQAMGAFKLNVFYLVGMIGSTAAAWITKDGSYSNTTLNLSLLFAFARFYPDLIIYVMFVLPLKVKWLAWISAIFVLITFILASGWAIRLSILCSLANYLIFFGGEIVSEARQRKEVAYRRQKFERSVNGSGDSALHLCSVCGRTEETAPEIEFRVARDGEEYCMEHLPPKDPQADGSTD